MPRIITDEEFKDISSLQNQLEGEKTKREEILERLSKMDPLIELAKLKDKGFLLDEDVVILADFFADLLKLDKNNPEASLKGKIALVMEHFTTNINLEKRLSPIAEKYPAVNLLVPVIKSIIARKAI